MTLEKIAETMIFSATIDGQPSVLFQTLDGNVLMQDINSPTIEDAEKCVEIIRGLLVIELKRIVISQIRICK